MEKLKIWVNPTVTTLLTTEIEGGFFQATPEAFNGVIFAS